MATLREITNDIRSVYPQAVAIRRSEAKRMIRRSVKHTSQFVDSLTPVEIDGELKILVIDLAKKLYQAQAGGTEEE